MDWWQNLWRGGSSRPFRAWQIEVTSRCALRCRMCAKEAEPERPGTEMAPEDFARIAPELEKVEHVVLEGWGESLLRRDLEDLVAQAARTGARPGFVTSGTGMSPERAEALTKAGISFVGFSLAGATAKTHETIRVHSRFAPLWASVAWFAERYRRAPSASPRPHVVFLLLQDNAAELPALVQLAGEAGIPEVRVIHIVHIANPWQEAQRAFVYEGASPVRWAMEEARAVARQQRVGLTLPPATTGQVAVCGENPLSTLYIAVDGSLSPCVFLNPPLSSPFVRIFRGQEHFQERVVFGNILREPFARIWEKEAYRDFRERFARRRRHRESLYNDFLAGRRPPAETLPDPPEPCRTCHRLWGV